MKFLKELARAISLAIGLAAFLAFAAASALAQPLNGTYTIGGTSPNYSSFTLAVNDLITKGINGPVTFFVRPGTYNERFQIPQINGAGPDRRITFRGIGTPLEQVITGTSMGPTDHHIIKLSGADYLRFERLTISNPAVVYGTGIFLTEHADHNEFYDLRILMDTTAETANTAGILITGPGTSTSLIAQGNSASHISFKKISVSGGDASFWLSGGLSLTTLPPAPLDSVIVIDSCSFTHGLRKGLDIQLYGRVQVSNCFIKPSHRAPLSGMTGLQLLQVGNTQVLNNQIYSKGEVGVQVMCDITASAFVANNFIMHFYYPQYTSVHGLAIRSGLMKSRVVNNSIWFDNEPGDSLDPGNRYNHAALRHYAGSVLFMNNSVYNQGPGYVFSSENQGLDSLDHNNYYSTSPRFINWQGTHHSTLNQHKSNTGKDRNSWNLLPGYLSKSNLHANGTALNGKGIYLNYNTRDIDGEERIKNGPDIGADEFVPDGPDLGIWEIRPQRAFVGSNKVSVDLANQGTSSLNGKSVELQFSTDSGSTWSTPESVALTALGALGNTQTHQFTSSWNAPEQGSVDLCARVKNPGYPGDINPLNDFRCIKACVGDSSQVFRVGSNRDFKSISDVIAHLLSAGCGVVRPTLYLVDSGLYQELIYLPPVPGMSKENTVTFRGATGNAQDVHIKAAGKGSSTDHGILNFREGRHFVFEDLMFTNTQKDTASVVHLPSMCKSNTFRRCILALDSGDLDTRYGCYFGQLRGGYIPYAIETDSNLFEQCTFIGGHTGIRFLSGTYYFLKAARGNRFLKNLFLDQLGHGMDMEGPGVTEVQGNQISSSKANPGSRGIRIKNCPDLPELSGNRVLDGYSIGMDVADPAVGFRMYNNAVALNPRQTSTTFGISLGNPGLAHVYHNSVYLGPRSAEDSRAWLLLNSVTCSVANNLFINHGKGTAAYVFPDGGDLFSDRNVWFTGGSKLAFWGTDYADLAALRAGTGQEKTGFQFLPEFKDTLDLHTEDVRLDSAGLAMGVLLDWEGDPRDGQYPDLGADEFGVPPINSVTVEPAAGGYMIWPNPLPWKSQNLFLRLEPDKFQGKGPIEVSLMDLTGRIWWFKELDGPITDEIIELHLASSNQITENTTLVPGLYLIHLRTNLGPTRSYPLMIE